MTTTIWIILGLVLLIVLLIVFAKSAAREANRMTIEVDHRLDSLNSLLESMDVDDQESERLVRKATRHKARADEVAGRQTPMWKAYSKTVRKIF